MLIVGMFSIRAIIVNYQNQLNKKYPNYDLAMRYLDGMFPDVDKAPLTVEANGNDDTIARVTTRGTKVRVVPSTPIVNMSAAQSTGDAERGQAKAEEEAEGADAKPAKRGT